MNLLWRYWHWRRAMLRRRFADIDLAISPQRWSMMRLGVAGLIFALTGVLGLPWSWRLSLAWSGVRLLSRMYLGLRRKEYETRCQTAVPEMARLLAAELRRGGNLQSACEAVAGSAGDRVCGALLRRANAAIAYGLPPAEALSIALRRLTEPACRRHAAALSALLGLDGGANMAASLQLFADIAEQEVQAREAARGLCAEPRMVAIALPALALAVVLLLGFGSPGYGAAYFTPIGTVAAVLALAVMAAGAVWIRRTTAFAVP